LGAAWDGVAGGGVGAVWDVVAGGGLGDEGEKLGAAWEGVAGGGRMRERYWGLRGRV
jgi:hypothetical protein